MIHTQDADFTLLQGDVLEQLATLEDESVHCVVTSPPYWGLRDYGTGEWTGGDPDCDHLEPGTEREELSNPPAGWAERAQGKPYGDVCGKCGATRVDQQLGLEATPDQYVTQMVEVFREIRRVLRRDGTCWVNLGDSYASGEIGRNDADRSLRDYRDDSRKAQAATQAPRSERKRDRPLGLKPKDLVGVPWRVAFALQNDGWYLRADIIWAKPNPMPESVTDRPTKAHEYVFLLTRSPRYFFDQEAVREPHLTNLPVVEKPTSRRVQPGTIAKIHEPGRDGWGSLGYAAGGRNVRSVWEIAEEQPALDPNDPPLQPKVPKEQLTRRAKSFRDGGVYTQGRSHDNSADKTKATHGDGEPSLSGRNVRSVWEIATQPYPEAHFATYPEELVRRCILAGTSEYGCCPVCGTPWEREVDKTPVPHWKGGSVTGAGDSRAADYGANGKARFNYDVTTLGWRPGCDCKPLGSDGLDQPGVWEFTHSPIPCTVLDPFLGSGTTAHVARKHGRRSIGIELNPDYCELAARRLQQQSLFA